METKHTYDIVLHHEDGVYWGEVPSLPGCYAEGDTKAEVLADVREAIRFHLRGLSEMAVSSDVELAQVCV